MYVRSGQLAVPTLTRRQQSLKMIAEGVASIDISLHVEAARLIAIATLDVYEAGGAAAAALSWQRIELALYLVYGFGQSPSHR